MAALFSRWRADAQMIVRSVALSAAFTVAGFFLMTAGIAFLTAALWITIAASYGALAAFLTLGLIYSVLGVLCLVLATRRPRGARYRQPPAPAPPPREPLVQIAEGFAIGMQAGRAARGRPR